MYDYQSYLEAVREYGGEPMTLEEWENQVAEEAQEGR